MAKKTKPAYNNKKKERITSIPEIKLKGYVHFEKIGNPATILINSSSFQAPSITNTPPPPIYVSTLGDKLVDKAGNILTSTGRALNTSTGFLQNATTWNPSSITSSEQAQKLLENPGVNKLYSQYTSNLTNAQALAAEKLQKVLLAREKLENTIEKYNKYKDAYNTVKGIPLTKSFTKRNIAAVVATQSGLIRAKLIAEVETKIGEYLDKFADTCPSQNTLQRIERSKNTLQKSAGGLSKRLDSFRRIVPILQGTVPLLKASIKLLFADPTPTAVIPPQVGGLGIRVGKLTLASDYNLKLNRRLEEIQNQIDAINSIVSLVSTASDKINDRLGVLDLYIERCKIYNTSEDPLEAINTLNDRVEKQITPLLKEKEVEVFYNNFKLTVVEDKSSGFRVTKRYAIAQDPQGVTVLRGPSSFSSDPQILIEELKFRIDNKLA